MNISSRRKQRFLGCRGRRGCWVPWSRALLLVRLAWCGLFVGRHLLVWMEMWRRNMLLAEDCFWIVVYWLTYYWDGWICTCIFTGDLWCFYACDSHLELSSDGENNLDCLGYKLTLSFCTRELTECGSCGAWYCGAEGWGVGGDSGSRLLRCLCLKERA